VNDVIGLQVGDLLDLLALVKEGKMLDGDVGFLCRDFLQLVSTNFLRKEQSPCLFVPCSDENLHQRAGFSAVVDHIF
jgi:hypothetical protein